MNGPLHGFRGGLDLDGRRHTRDQAIRPGPLPRTLVLPLHQHIGEPAEPVVAVGDTVLRGQPVARADNYVCAPVHASSSGTVVAIEDRPVPHPSGLSAPCIVIETDGEDRWAPPLPPIDNPTDTPARVLRARIREAGIVGLGGAAFPTAIKLNPPTDTPPDTLIVNGVECDTHLTCDDRLMRERPTEILSGAAIAAGMLGAGRVRVAVESDKPEAAHALERALEDSGLAHGPLAWTIDRIPKRYPAGSERQLIENLTGRRVPPDGLPKDVGAITSNVATFGAIHRAVRYGEPLTQRIVTVTGDGVRQPGNLEARIGTPVSELIAHCGGYQEDVAQLVMGGSLMGRSLLDDAVPVIKGTNCLLAATPVELTPAAPAMPCIRCGACAEVCPEALTPQQIYWHTRSRDYALADDWGVFDCIECGACAWVCPSQIPLVQYFRHAKGAIAEREKEQARAELARRRHEFRQERLEREKQEQAERRRRKKEALKQGKDDRKATINAALARARRKKSAEKED